MNEPLESAYFIWLCAKVTSPSDRRSYDKLFKLLHTTEFVWRVPGDDNRASDGKELRREFLILGDIPDDVEWRHFPCSVFEMLIAFSKRAEFQTGILARDWFWQFLTNLQLNECDDYNADADYISDVLYTFVWRIYEKNGEGGIFPMLDTHSNQRGIELWYQFFDYLVAQNIP